MQKTKSLFVLLILAILGYGLFIYSSARESRLLPDIAGFSQQQAIAAAEAFIASQDLLADTEAYQAAVGFDSHQYGLAFMTNNLGQQQAHAYYRKHQLPLLVYDVRWFKELQQDQVYIGIDAETGEVVNFYTELSEKTARASLSKAEARELALAFANTKGFIQDTLEEKNYSSEQFDQRIDHSFVFKIKGTDIDSEWGTAYRQIKVAILGDRVGRFNHYLFVPEDFTRSISGKQGYGQLLTILSALATLVMFIIAATVLIRQFIGSRVHWQLFGYLSIILVGISIADYINLAGLMTYFYDSELSFVAFFGVQYTGLIIGSVIVGLMIFVSGTAGNAIYQTTWNSPAPFALTQLKANLTRGILVAYPITGILLGVTAITYLLGKAYLGVWVMADVLPFEFLLTPLPFLSILVMYCLLAPFSEELMYRLFGITFFKKYIKSTWLAILIPTVIWAVAHSNYPVFPYYFRAIELIVAGLLFGFLFLRYGIISVIVAHYLYNALQFAALALASGSAYIIGSEVLVLVLPLLVAWLWHWRNSKA